MNTSEMLAPTAQKGQEASDWVGWLESRGGRLLVKALLRRRKHIQSRKLQNSRSLLSKACHLAVPP